MKWLITNDLHQMGQKWSLLIDAIKIHHPEWVFITGDILPKEQFSFLTQKKFFLNIEKYLNRMRNSGVSRVFTYLGNDDLHPLESELNFLHQKELCLNMDQRTIIAGKHVVAGMNKVRDYPFGYKHWCHPDGQYIVDPIQFTRPVTVDIDGEWVEIPDLKAYMLAKPTIKDLLEELEQHINLPDIINSVWMMHQPPALCGMDICANGMQVGSPTVLTFIERIQPLLTMHGHIHESPYQPNGQWHKRIGRTHVIQPGQLGARLHYVMVEVDDGIIKKLEWHHSRSSEPEVLEFNN